MSEELYGLWYSEITVSAVGFEVSRKIAALLAKRVCFGGSAIIVTDRPRSMASVYGKRWRRILRAIENERASTMNHNTKAELKSYEDLLAGIKFLVGVPEETVHQTIWLVSADDLAVVPQGVAAIYVMSDLSGAQLRFWARGLEDGGSITLFRKQPLTMAGKG